jgi:hypothetical protein
MLGIRDKKREFFHVVSCPRIDMNRDPGYGCRLLVTQITLPRKSGR